jgi:hypothetical protein
MPQAELASAVYFETGHWVAADILDLIGRLEDGGPHHHGPA